MFNRDYRGSGYPGVVYPGDPRRSRFAIGFILRSISWEVVAVFAVLLGFFGFVLWQGQPGWQSIGTIGFVVVGWVFSLCLHEFAHAATAYMGGDRSDNTESYLSFNPLKYVNPLLSIILPVIFILIGFIALPGGAVYLQRHLIRNRVWQSLVSLAGPLMNGVCVVLLAIPFALFPDLTEQHPALAGGLAFLAFFEALAVVLNMLPIPGLDGFGVIAPWLPYNVRAALMPLASYGFIILLLLLWFVPRLSFALDIFIALILIAFRIDPSAIAIGQGAFEILNFGLGR